VGQHTTRLAGTQRQPVVAPSTRTLCCCCPHPAAHALLLLLLLAVVSRAIEAAMAAIDSPLLEVGIDQATGVVWNITGPRDITMSEVCVCECECECECEHWCYMCR
jgi:hypothetical protein